MRWAGYRPTSTRANGYNTTNNNQQPSKHPAHKTRPDQFIGRGQIVIASYFYDSAGHIEFEDLEEALATGNRAGGSANLRSKARIRHFPLEWRWGESNPRPAAGPEFFSERSLRFYFSAPSIA